MIVVRNVFQIQFGKAKEAVGMFKEGIGIAARVGGAAKSMRLLTDVTGPFYTLVLEVTHESLSDFERGAATLMGSNEWKAWYPKAVALCTGGYREILTVHE